MKRLLFFLLILIGGLGIQTSRAQTHNSSATVHDKIVYLKPKVTPVRPNSPSMIVIPCMYDEGFIILDFPEGIQYGTVTMTNVQDPEDVWYGFASVEEPVLIIPSFIGAYTIECVVDDGRVFHEVLYF